MQEHKSEVARLREQIAQEYLAATRGLSGLATGISRHDFIQVRMENMACCHQRLSILLGSTQEATKLVAETLEQADVLE